MTSPQRIRSKPYSKNCNEGGVWYKDYSPKKGYAVFKGPRKGRYNKRMCSAERRKRSRSMSFGPTSFIPSTYPVRPSASPVRPSASPVRTSSSVRPSVSPVRQTATLGEYNPPVIQYGKKMGKKRELVTLGEYNPPVIQYGKKMGKKRELVTLGEYNPPVIQYGKKMGKKRSVHFNENVEFEPIKFDVEKRGRRKMSPYLQGQIQSPHKLRPSVRTLSGVYELFVFKSNNKLTYMLVDSGPFEMKCQYSAEQFIDVILEKNNSKNIQVRTRQNYDVFRELYGGYNDIVDIFNTSDEINIHGLSVQLAPFSTIINTRFAYKTFTDMVNAVNDSLKVVLIASKNLGYIINVSHQAMVDLKNNIIKLRDYIRFPYSTSNIIIYSDISLVNELLNDASNLNDMTPVYRNTVEDISKCMILTEEEYSKLLNFNF